MVGLRHRHLVRWVTVLVVLDVLVFALFCSEGFLPGHANVEPSRAYALTLIDPVGRYASGRSLGQQSLHVRRPRGGEHERVHQVVERAGLRFAASTNSMATSPTPTLSSVLTDASSLAASTTNFGSRPSSCPPTNSPRSRIPVRRRPRVPSPAPAPSVVRYFGAVVPVRSVEVTGVDDRSVDQPRERAVTQREG